LTLLNGGSTQDTDQFESTNINSSLLKHLVFLNLKPDIDLELLLLELQALSEIATLDSFSVGKFIDLNDPKAMSNYEIIMEMTFKDVEAYQAYQEDSLHVAMVKKTKSFMEGPPLSYDYMIN
jgi:hypothetical protein